VTYSNQSELGGKDTLLQEGKLTKYPVLMYWLTTSKILDMDSVTNVISTVSCFKVTTPHFMSVELKYVNGMHNLK